MNKIVKIITIAAAAVATTSFLNAGCGTCAASKDKDHDHKHEHAHGHDHDHAHDHGHAHVAKEKGFYDVSHEQLKEWMAEGKVTLIDVNGSSSYQKGHIPGAVDFAAVKSEIASVLPEDKDALIVAYCGGPKCGAYKKAAKAAVALGYTHVMHYSGGLSGWKKAGEEVEKG